MRLPFVLELAADDEQDELRDKVRKLTLLCSRMHRNISTWRVNENIFELDSVGQVVIMAGEGSAQTFRQNLYLRLAEVFYNLEWLMKERPSEFKVREFEAYDRL